MIAICFHFIYELKENENRYICSDLIQIQQQYKYMLEWKITPVSTVSTSRGELMPRDIVIGLTPGHDRGPL